MVLNVVGSSPTSHPEERNFSDEIPLFFAVRCFPCAWRRQNKKACIKREFNLRLIHAFVLLRRIPNVPSCRMNWAEWINRTVFPVFPACRVSLRQGRIWVPIPILRVRRCRPVSLAMSRRWLGVTDPPGIPFQNQDGIL